MAPECNIAPILATYLGVAGTPKFPALCDSPTLSIHVPAFHLLPPNTNPVSSRTPAVTLNPALVMWQSKSGPAPRSRKLMPMKWRCITSWMTSYSGWALVKNKSSRFFFPVWCSARRKIQMGRGSPHCRVTSCKCFTMQKTKLIKNGFNKSFQTV